MIMEWPVAALWSAGAQVVRCPPGGYQSCDRRWVWLFWGNLQRLVAHQRGHLLELGRKCWFTGMGAGRFLYSGWWVASGVPVAGPWSRGFGTLRIDSGGTKPRGQQCSELGGSATCHVQWVSGPSGGRRVGASLPKSHTHRRL